MHFTVHWNSKRYMLFDKGATYKTRNPKKNKLRKQATPQVYKNASSNSRENRKVGNTLCSAQNQSIRNMNSSSRYDVIKQKWMMSCLAERSRVALFWFQTLQTWCSLCCMWWNERFTRSLVLIWEKQGPPKKYSRPCLWSRLIMWETLAWAFEAIKHLAAICWNKKSIQVSST